jgi:chorismate mutase
MMENDKYFIVKKKAIPEVLLKVVEAKRLLDSEKVITIQEATDSAGISRSSFYKYKDDIFPFHDNAGGKTITLMLQMDDEPGLLSEVLNQVARNGANILTINQTIPINGIALLTISVEILPTAVDVTEMIDDIESLVGIHSLKIVARE